MDTNPLLHFDGLPLFSKVKVEHMEPAIDLLLQQCRETVEKIVRFHSTGVKPTWETLVLPLDLTENKLNRAWSVIGHMNSVVNSKSLRLAYTACQSKISEYGSDVNQNKELYSLTNQLFNSTEFQNLTQAEKKSLENSMLSFVLNGVNLPDKKRQRFKKIKQKLSELESTFEQNVLDSTAAWSKKIVDQKDLTGLPDSTIALAKQNAEQSNQSGCYIVSLQAPFYTAVMSYADSRALRKEMYHAYNTRSSEFGDREFDNTEIIEQILSLRYELAQLIGFANYAEMSLATKMAEKPEDVIGFLEELSAKSRSVAEKELEELKSFANEQGEIDLQAWDLAYYAEKLRKSRYGIDREELKPWFQLSSVLKGLFEITERLYSIKIKELSNIDVWHKDVKVFEIIGEDDTLRGQFFLDVYARDNKRSGAWMDVCTDRFKLENGKVQLPVAYLTCNFSPPVVGKPVLLAHEEVITLFHEFGHGLHHLLTNVDCPSVAGINGVQWDAVELPSQLMENWCWQPEALDLFARHYEHDQPLSVLQKEKMQAAKNFQAALMMLRQIEFSLFDFDLHLKFDPTNSDKSFVSKVLEGVRQKVSVFQPPKFNRFQNAFSHIFSGGYAAGYYSYKWSEVLSADVFSVFQDNGIFDRATGKRFCKYILEKGGAEDALTLFKYFRGRAPEVTALLKQTGLE